MATKIPRVQIILNTPYETINSLNEKELREIGNILVSSSNKRIRRIAEQNDGIVKASSTIPSLVGLKLTKESTDVKTFNKHLKNDLQFTIKNLNYKELKSAVKEMIEFNKEKTSSVTGYKKFEKETRERISEDYGVQIDKSQFWQIYNRMMEQGNMKGYKGSGYGSAQAQRTLANYISRKIKRGEEINVDEIPTSSYLRNKIKKEIRNEYESKIEQEEESKSTSFRSLN